MSRCWRVSARASTAVAFSLLGLATLLARSRFSVRPWFVVLVVVVAAIAVAKLIEFSTGRSLGFDELFVEDPAAFGAVRKGRMSPITALAFLLASSAMLASAFESKRRHAGPLAVAVLLISGTVLLGYLHNTPILYGGAIIPVALPTAAAFFLLSVSIIVRNGPAHWPLAAFVGDSTRALLLRRFLPTIVLLATVDGVVRAQFLRAGQVNPAILSAASTILFVTVVTLLISRLAHSVGARIDKAEAERNAATEALAALNQTLEKRVADRTMELRTKNEQMEEELQMARELQLAMLPRVFPRIPEAAAPEDSALQFFTFYYPTGGVSGDYFNIFPVSETSVGVLICDVMGHGVRAALVTSLMRALVEQHGGRNCDPGQLLTRLNHGLRSILSQSETTLFATATVIILDVAAARLAYANAAHPKPLHLTRADGRTAFLNGKTGPALGLFDGASYPTATIPISVGDVVMLFTDGLFEVESPDAVLYSQRELLEAVQKHRVLPPAQLFRSVIGEVQDFAARPDFDDDVCLIGVEFTQDLLQTGQPSPELAR